MKSDSKRFSQTPLPFDIFLSYKSEDEAWVKRLQHALSRRGVKVWRDRSHIRPGDRFAEALERGIEASRSLALIVSPQSLASEWVKEEYYRALSLSNERRLQLIPLVLQNAQLPGFLSNRQWIDFRTNDTFDRDVDRLVWPGITGKSVVIVTVCGYYKRFGMRSLPIVAHWKRLLDTLYEQDFEVIETENLYYCRFELRPDWKEPKEWLMNDATKRLVVILDMFEGRFIETMLHHSASPSEYADFMFDIRDATAGRSNEVVFLLYHQAGALSGLTPESGLDHAVHSRLQHYLTLHQDASSGNFRRRFADVWISAQKILMRSSWVESASEELGERS